MFVHSFKYCLKVLFKEKTGVFWTLIFPILLGTFMYMSFGNIMETQEMFKDVKVAVVENEKNESLDAVLDALSTGDDALFEVEKMSEEAATKALEEKTIQAIIYSKDISMKAIDDSYKTAVVESFVRQYKQSEYVYNEIMKTNPEKGMELIKDAAKSKDFYQEIKTTDGNMNMYTNYFFAIFAMSCLFAAFNSVYTANNMQGNVSALGMRRCVSPANKLTVILAEFSALLLLQFVIELIALGYFTVIGVDFGTKYPAIMLLLLVGCMFGIALGTIVGSISKMSLGGKIGIAVSIGMGLSVMADLCVPGIKYFMQQHAPIVNKINPAALMTDSFYALGVYDDYSRYFGNITILVAETVVLIVVSFLMVRRNKYASV